MQRASCQTLIPWITQYRAGQTEIGACVFARAAALGADYEDFCGISAGKNKSLTIKLLP